MGEVAWKKKIEPKNIILKEGREKKEEEKEEECMVNTLWADNKKDKKDTRQ